MRTVRIFLCDVRYQFKYGFYFLYAVITAVYIGILLLLPETIIRQAAALIIMSDPAALGFFFVGGMILLERGEGLHGYYAVLPSATREYVIAKALSLSFISTLVGIAVASFVLGPGVNYMILTAGLLAGSALFTLLGVIIGTLARSVNHYFVLGVPVGVVLMSPAFLTVFGISNLLVEILPATLLLRLLYNALGLETPYPAWVSLAGLIIWLVPSCVLASRRFAAYLGQVGG